MVIAWLMMVNNNLVGGLNPSEKCEFVSYKIHVPNHQPATFCGFWQVKSFSTHTRNCRE
jgi:hypothetical protein